MPEYTAQVLVTYTIVADTHEDALELLTAEGSREHPFFPYGAGWCKQESVVSINPKENN